MRKIILVLLTGCVLTACGPSATPSSRGLSAFREGDHNALVTAARDAEEEIKTAIQPGDDLCKVTTVDITKYNARYMIRALDRQELLKLPEEDRLVYALKIAGRSSQVWPESFVGRSPLIYETPDNRDACPKERKAYMAKQFEVRAYMLDDAQARLGVFEDWIADMKSRYGDQYDERMLAAARDLEANGYSAQWPMEISL